MTRFCVARSGWPMPCIYSSPKMKPVFFGQCAQVCSNFVKLIVIGCPLDMLLKPQLLLDGHGLMPSRKDQR